MLTRLLCSDSHLPMLRFYCGMLQNPPCLYGMFSQDTLTIWYGKVETKYVLSEAMLWNFKHIHTKQKNVNDHLF